MFAHDDETMPPTDPDARIRTETSPAKRPHLTDSQIELDPAFDSS